MSSAANRGVSGAVTMGILSLALAGAAAYGATALEIKDAQALVYVTFAPAAGMALVATILDFVAATMPLARGRRLFEYGLIMFGLALGWLAFCGVFAAAAAMLSGDGGNVQIG